MPIPAYFEKAVPHNEQCSYLVVPTPCYKEITVFGRCSHSVRNFAVLVSIPTFHRYPAIQHGVSTGIENLGLPYCTCRGKGQLLRVRVRVCLGITKMKLMHQSRTYTNDLNSPNKSASQTAPFESIPAQKVSFGLGLGLAVTHPALRTLCLRYLP